MATMLQHETAEDRVSSTVVHDQTIKVAAGDQDKLEHNEIPLSPGKLREKYKVSIAYVSEDGDKRESIIGYYDTEIEAIEAYEQTEQSIRHANHRQVTSDLRSENEMEQETDLEEIFDRIVKGGTHENSILSCTHSLVYLGPVDDPFSHPRHVFQTSLKSYQK